jgi:hypothetical protein
LCVEKLLLFFTTTPSKLFRKITENKTVSRELIMRKSWDGKEKKVNKTKDLVNYLLENKTNVSLYFERFSSRRKDILHFLSSLKREKLKLNLI